MQSENCEFCKANSECTSHIFFDCSVIRSFWSELEKMLNRKCDLLQNIRFTKAQVMLLQNETDGYNEILNKIILLAKYHIYRCKVVNIRPHLKTFINELYRYYTVEKEAEISLTGEVSTTQNRWKKYENMFLGLLSD